MPIEVGRWYHLAVTSNALDLRVYVDGYECALTGGALDFSRAKANGDELETVEVTLAGTPVSATHRWCLPA